MLHGSNRCLLTHPTTMLAGAGGCNSSWNRGTELPSMYLHSATSTRVPLAFDYVDLVPHILH
jgi:hypothetical protein